MERILHQRRFPPKRGAEDAPTASWTILPEKLPTSASHLGGADLQRELQMQGHSADLPVDVTQTQATLKEKASSFHIDPKETSALRMSQNNQTMSMPDALEKTQESNREARIGVGPDLPTMNHIMGSEGLLAQSPNHCSSEIIPRISPQTSVPKNTRTRRPRHRRISTRFGRRTYLLRLV